MNGRKLIKHNKDFELAINFGYDLGWPTAFVLFEENRIDL